MAFWKRGGGGGRCKKETYDLNSSWKLHVMLVVKVDRAN